MTHEISTQDVADALMVLVIELVAASAPTDTIADQRLEDVAGKLLTQGGQMPESAARELILALAKNLIQTERGAGLR